MVRTLASHQCGPGSIPARCHMWVEFVVGSLLALLEGFSLGSPVFPLHKKQNNSKFEFDLACVASVPVRAAQNWAAERAASKELFRPAKANVALFPSLHVRFGVKVMSFHC